VLFTFSSEEITAGTIMSPARKKGFTLVEVLVVTVIFSIIGVGIMTSFVSGVKIWRRSQDLFRVYGDLILTLEKVSRELRHSVNIPDIGFEAVSSNEFSFPALVGSSCMKVTYRFDPQEKTLLRGQVRLKDIIAEKEKEEYEKEKDEYREGKIIDLEELNINYFYFNKDDKSLCWQDSWKKEDGILRLVKLNGKYNGKEFTKIILIPIF